MRLNNGALGRPRYLVLAMLACYPLVLGLAGAGALAVEALLLVLVSATGGVVSLPPSLWGSR